MEENRLAADGTYVFLSGAKMNPTVAREVYPDAHFVARARLQANVNDIAPPFSASLAAGSDEIWGIILASQDGQSTTPRRTAITDDGREVQVEPHLPLLDGDTEVVLAAARYWELPPAYIARLAAAVSGDSE
jgi:hypothetical protein